MRFHWLQFALTLGTLATVLSFGHRHNPWRRS